MKKHKKLNLFITSVTFLMLSFGLLHSPVFADCQTTITGTQTSDWRQMFLHHNPTGEVCGCVIGFCWTYFTGYSDTTGGSLEPVAADEIVVGGLTKVCERMVPLVSNPEGCPLNVTSTDYPSVDTTIAIYLEKLPMG